MSTRNDAQKYLNQLNACKPRTFYDDLEATKRGVGFVLGYLEQAEDEVVAGDFAKMLNVSTARIAALLKKMEQDGLITRRNSLTDARRTVVETTPKGAAFAAETRERALAVVELLLDRVGKEDLDTFIRISHKMREALDE